MKFIILIILFFAVIFFLVPSIIAGIIRFFLTMLGGGTGSSSYRNTTNRDENYTRFKNNETSAPDGTKKKVFDKDEGEYVSFEEIKKETNEDSK
ncbi:MAG: DUF4834 family protein [Bacteroidales bacterium]|nr:DUF4834 family protein [Bacteroidales bacterium]MBR2606762.1 DUF4834 family protein [Bacteroidaceae bacterium]